MNLESTVQFTINSQACLDPGQVSDPDHSPYQTHVDSELCQIKDKNAEKYIY